jgi:hypothetical protein
MLSVPSSTACSSALLAPLACRLCAVRELRWLKIDACSRSRRSAPRGACRAGRRLALFDEAPSAFVIVVGVMGENADRHILL